MPTKKKKSSTETKQTVYCPNCDVKDVLTDHKGRCPHCKLVLKLKPNEYQCSHCDSIRNYVYVTMKTSVKAFILTKGLIKRPVIKTDEMRTLSVNCPHCESQL